MKSIAQKVAVSVAVSVIGTLAINYFNRKVLKNNIRSTYTFIQL